MPLLDFPDYSVNFTKALTAIPEHIVGQHGVPDLTDPMSQYRYLEKRRSNIIESVKQRPLVRLFDKEMKFVGQIASERSVMVEEVMADSGAGSIVLRRDNWLSDFILYDRRAEEDLHVTVDPIATSPDWRTRWGGKVLGVNAKRDNQGLHSVELEMVSNREHLKHLLAGCNPIFPPEVQLPKMWVLPWNCRTALSITMFINLARQFFPFLSIPTNIFNPGAWVGTGILQGIDPLSWPIQVQFVNPIFDQSRFTVYTSRWNDMHTTTAQLLEDAGCMIRAYTWLLEDTSSPHPELESRVNSVIPELEADVGVDFPADLPWDFAAAPKPKPKWLDLARPHRNCVIMAVEDKSGVTGPTGCVSADTVIDGPDGSERIDILAKHGRPFRVWSRTPAGDTVPATATYAFHKGRAELFEYALTDGRSIKGTADHRFLTEAGWMRGGALQVGSKIATTDSEFVSLIDIMSLGVDDYYDMTVPIWENYAAQGIWNHNTLIDGVIKLAAATADDLITETIYPVDKDADGVTDPFFRKLTLTAPHPPWVVFRDGEYSGIVESQRSMHAATAKTIMVGSKSPGWVNQLQTFGIKYGLARLSEAIELGLREKVPPGTPGLEELYQGQLDDTLLAWQRFTDPRRALRMGDFGFLEHFEQGSGSAYTIAAVIDLRTGHFKTRSYVSFKTTIRNGAPYLAGYDFQLGDRLGFEMANVIHVDQCTAIRHSWDDSTPITVELSVGNDSAEEDPVSVATRTLAALWNGVAMFLGEGSMF